MNLNSSHVALFSLTAYFPIGPLRYPFFILLIVFYSIIVLSNALFMALICLNRSLHEPMYILFCSLFANSILGSSIIYPFLSHQILQDVHVVPSGLCFVQAFSIHLYGITEYFTLSVMSYDRYLAICAPLQYNTLMSRTKLAVLVPFPWLYAFFICFIMIMLSSSLQLCGNVINKVYRDNHPIVKLACSVTAERNIYGLVISMVNIFSPLTLILVTYARILRVCFVGGRHAHHKAMSTCLPHVLSLMNFGIGAASEFIQYRVNMSGAPELVRIFLSLYFWLVQPMLDPFIYRFNTSKIRARCKSLFVSKAITCQQ